MSRRGDLVRLKRQMARNKRRSRSQVADRMMAQYMLGFLPPPTAREQAAWLTGEW